MKKRILSIVLAICMVLAFMPQMAFAETTSGITENGLKYTISDAGEVTITGYAGSPTTVEIPSSIEYESVTYSVTAIGEKAFNDCKSLTTIKIPSSVTSIGDLAFNNCIRLTNIIVDNNNANFSSGDGVLFNKDKTELIYYPLGKTDDSYIIPDGVKSIGNRAFYKCTRLTSVTIPNSVTSIGGSAFFDCTKLKSVSILGNVTSIGISTFSGCTQLTSITIPDSVTLIGRQAFYRCENLPEINIPEGLLSIEDGTFSYGKSLTSITIPDSVTSIGALAFYDCNNLATITIPKTVTYIGGNAFKNTSWLTSKMKADPLVVVNGILIDGKSATGEVIIPDGVTSIGNYAFYDCKSINSVTIPNSVTSIGNYAFYDCKSINSVTIPNSVTSIGGSAFNGCKNLEIIFLPDNNLSIESNAIPATASQVKYSLAEYKATITSASLGNGRTTLEVPSTIRDYPVSAINNSAFAGCTSLESIFLPASLDDTNAGIPDTASRVKYSLDTDKDEVTIIEITLGTGRTSVDIPETIFDYPVVAVADGYQNLVGAHTHNLVNIPAKAPKYTEAGYKEHWQCTLCNKYFSDASGTTEIADLENWKTNEGKIDKLTAPAPGKSDSVASDKEGNVSVTIEKSIVTVNGKTEVIVSESIANTILSKLASSSSRSVVINATTGKNIASKPIAAGSGISTHINFPKSVVKKLTEIEGIEITLVTDNGKVVLDKETIAAVAAKAGNDGQVTLVIETVEQKNNLLKIELKIKTSNGDVTDFNKGNVKVTVVISEVLKGKKPVCVYIDEDGRYHKIGGMLNADGTFTFVIGHFSTYAIIAEEEADTVMDAQQKEETIAALADQQLAARSKLVTMKNGKKAVKITWYNKNGDRMDFDGVEIYRSTKKNSGYGKKPIFTSKTDKYTNTSVKAGTRYYYKVRGFVIIDGQKHYTDYSLKAIRTVK